LAVFPKQSSHALPECYHKLYDPTSEIIDFYPTDVKLDVNGARFAWMGVNLLPFLDRERLKKAMNDADESKLLSHEKIRNKRTGDIRLFYLKNAKQSQL
jgi:5'-3' exonuclease